MTSSDLVADVTAKVRDIPDFPTPGVLFKDITPVLQDPALFRRLMDWMAEGWGPVDVIVGIESRGFIFGAPLVERLGAGLVLARKAGKLPWDTVAVDYKLEYGTARLEMHSDAIKPGQRVLLVDDLLATGGTAEAAVSLVRRLGGDVIGLAFAIELAFLEPRKRFSVPIKSLLQVG